MLVIFKQDLKKSILFFAENENDLKEKVFKAFKDGKFGEYLITGIKEYQDMKEKKENG